jgi:hypothetical protein
MSVIDEYAGVVEGLLEALRAWIESDRDFLDADLAAAIATLCGALEDDELAAECAALAAAVGRLRRAALRHDERCDEANSVLLKPDSDLMEALRATVEAGLASRRRPRTQLESVAALREQKVPDAQICQIYGWGSWESGWDYRKVDEELKQPGCHSYADPKWMAPHDRRRAEEDREEAQRWKNLFEQLDRKVRSWTRQPKETLKELLEQKVHLEQLCVLFRCDEEEILRRCKAESLPAPERLANVATMRGTYDRPEPPEITRIFEAGTKAEGFSAKSGKGEGAGPIAEAEPEESESEGESAGASGLTEEQRIVGLHLGGQEPAAIARELKVAKRRVEAVLARYRQEPEAFGEVEPRQAE